LKPITVPTILLACICFVGLAQPLLGQTATASETQGIPGYLDPRTGAFRPTPQVLPDLEEIQAASTTVTGKLVFNFTITVTSTGLSADTVVCGANAELVDAPTTGGIFILESAAVGVKEASTVSCTVTIPYSWTLATMSTDKVTLTYTISVGGTTATTVLPNRTSSRGLGSINVPANGATTTETIKATI
jgi:hypothetical protein